MNRIFNPYNYYKFWFLLFFIGMGLVVPQVSPYVFSELGISSAGIIFLAGQVAMPIGTLLTGFVSDKTLRIRTPVVFMSLLSGISVYFFSAAGNIENRILFTAITFSIFMFSIGGIISLINVSYLQSGFQSHSFGRVRLFGTAGFAISNAVIMFYRLVPSVAIRWSAFFFILSTGALYLLPPRRDIDFVAHERVTWSRIRKLSTSGLFSFFILIMFLFFFNYSVAEYIVSDYLKNFTFGVDPVAFSWLIGTMVEVVFFFISPYIILKYGPVTLIGISFIAGILRMIFLIYFKQESIVLFSQALHGIQFSGAYLGSLLYIEKKAHPQRLGSAQALFTMYGRAMGTGTGAYFLGNIAGTGNFHVAFEIGLWVCIAGLLLLEVFRRVEKKTRYFSD